MTASSMLWVIIATLMSLVVKKRLALAAFILMVLTLVWTLVRPRMPGSPVNRAELISIPIQIVLAILAFRTYRR